MESPVIPQSNDASDKTPLLQSRLPPRRRSWLLPLGAGVLAFLLYAISLAPTVTSEDSGELIGAAYFFGVAHPPGYPLWTMLCGLFIKLMPVGSIAWRANLFSAVCSAAAIVFFCRCLMLLRFHPLAAVSGAMICASGRVLWSQSVITEVYALHFLIFTMVCWSLLHWRDAGNTRWLLVASLLLGLGMSNHHTIAFTAVAGAAWVVLQSPAVIKNWRLLLLSICCFAAGFLPYVYIYVRAKADPPINWGNATTVQEVWNHFSRRQYRSSDNTQSKPPKESFRQRRSLQIKTLDHYCVQEYTRPVVAAAAFGFLAMLARREWRGLSFLLCLLLGNAGFHLLLVNPSFSNYIDLWCNQVFLLPLYACIAAAAAYAIASVFDGCGWLASRAQSSGRWPTFGIKVVVVLVAALLPLKANWSCNNMRHYWYAYDHAKNILDTMLPNAIIFPSGDHNTFPILYLSLVEGYRSDVIIADKYGYIDLNLYRDMPDNPGKPRSKIDRERIEEWIIRHARRPAYYTSHSRPLVPNANLVQAGILYHLLPGRKPFDADSCWSNYRYRNLDGQKAPIDFGASNILSDWEYFQGLRELKRDNPAAALAHFSRSAEYVPEIPQVANNIGSALAEHNQTDEAIRYYRRAADTDPAYDAPRWNLARVYKSRKQYPEAEAVFVELSRVTPDDFRVWGELGFLVAARPVPDMRRAVECWNRSLSLNPTQPQIIEQLYRHYASPSPAASEPTASQTAGRSQGGTRATATSTTPPTTTAPTSQAAAISGTKP